MAELYSKFIFDFNGNKKFSASSQFPSIINFLKNDNSLLYEKILNFVSCSIVINESIKFEEYKKSIINNIMSFLKYSFISLLISIKFNKNIL